MQTHINTLEYLVSSFNYFLSSVCRLQSFKLNQLLHLQHVLNYIWIYFNFNWKYLGNVLLPSTHCISSTQIFRVARLFSKLSVWKHYGQVNSLSQGETQTTIQPLAISSTETPLNCWRSESMQGHPCSVHPAHIRAHKGHLYKYLYDLEIKQKSKYIYQISLYCQIRQLKVLILASTHCKQGFFQVNDVH